jgi:hypothetical protein
MIISHRQTAEDMLWKFVTDTLNVPCHKKCPMDYYSVDSYVRMSLERFNKEKFVDSLGNVIVLDINYFNLENVIQRVLNTQTEYFFNFNFKKFTEIL